MLSNKRMKLTKRTSLVGGPALARRRRADFSESRFAAYARCSTDDRAVVRSERPVTDDHDGPEWLGTMVEYEGFPLALRVRPRADGGEQRQSLHYLAAVTHHLAQVRPDGLPDADYNDGLSSLDHAVIEALESGDGGLTVVVETLAGKRTYYAYVLSENHAEAAAKSLHSSFPDQELSLVVRRDEPWGLYAEYKRRFPW